MKSRGMFFGVALSLVIAGACMTGCDRRMESAHYDPQLDGVLPSDKAPPDLTILENQKTAYEKMREANAGAARPAASEPATPAVSVPG